MPDPSPEPTDLAYLRSLVREAVRPPEIGRVTTVRARDSQEAISNHEATVSLLRREQSLQDVPLVQPATGAALVPREGDLVLVAFAGAEADQPLVVGHLYADADADRAPLAEAGDVRLRRGELYAELADDGAHARLAKKPGDRDTPTAEVSIDDQGNVSIETDGDITVSAGGDVVIDEGGTATPVATAGHTHNFTYDGGGKNSSTLSGTTGQPSDTTSTEIE
jgi:hypothetical protein